MKRLLRKSARSNQAENRCGQEVKQTRFDMLLLEFVKAGRKRRNFACRNCNISNPFCQNSDTNFDRWNPESEFSDTDYYVTRACHNLCRKILIRCSGGRNVCRNPDQTDLKCCNSDMQNFRVFICSKFFRSEFQNFGIPCVRTPTQILTAGPPELKFSDTDYDTHA